jgi:hypothetical protein
MLASVRLMPVADSRAIVEMSMLTIVMATALSLATSCAFATCKSDSAAKKLAGAALTSLLK